MIPAQMGMNASETFKATWSQSVTGEVRDPDVLIIAHDHIGHLTLTCQQHGHLSFNFAGNGGNLPGKLAGYDLMGGYLTAIQILKSLLLAGLEAARFAMYFLDGLKPFLKMNVRVQIINTLT